MVVSGGWSNGSGWQQTTVVPDTGGTRKTVSGTTTTMYTRSLKGGVHCTIRGVSIAVVDLASLFKNLSEP